MPLPLTLSDAAATALMDFCTACQFLPRDLVIYVTSACNLRCRHCYLGSSLLDAAREYPESFLIAVLRQFSPLDRLTVLGGEPLLFRGLMSLLVECQLHAIAERRITTNLLVWPESVMDLLRSTGFRLVVSLDGGTRETHERYRGAGTYDPLLANLRRARSQSDDIEVTTTMSRLNLLEFPMIVGLLADFGILRLNLHSLSLQGNALTMADSLLTACEWARFRSALVSCVAEDRSSSLLVRVPWLVASDEELRTLEETGQYHPHADHSFYSSGKRLVLYPDGHVFVSSENFGSDHHLGVLGGDTFVPNEASVSELELYRREGKTPSDYRPVHRRDRQFPHLLSVSFKKTLRVDYATIAELSVEAWRTKLAI